MTRMSGTMIRCRRAACAGSTRVVVEAVRPASLDGSDGPEVVGPAQAVLAASSIASTVIRAPRVTS
jgi:hypothetical protein